VVRALAHGGWSTEEPEDRFGADELEPGRADEKDAEGALREILLGAMLASAEAIDQISVAELGRALLDALAGAGASLRTSRASTTT
jgi:hypothetical protein